MLKQLAPSQATATGTDETGLRWFTFDLDPRREDERLPFTWESRVTLAKPAARQEGDEPADDEPADETPGVLEGIASSNSRDSYGTDMPRATLDDMAEQMATGVALYAAHTKDAGPWWGTLPGWQDELGRTFDAVVRDAPVADLPDDSDDGDGYVLAFKAQLYDLAKVREDQARLVAELKERVRLGQAVGLSIGGWFRSVTIFQDDEGETRRVRVNKIELDHVALTARPANPDSWITALRSLRVEGQQVRAEPNWAATKYANLPIHEDHKEPWDWNAATQDEVLGDDGDDWPKYAKGHLAYDKANAEVKAGYKLPIAKMVDGRLRVVWRGLVAAMGRLGAADLPEAVKKAAHKHASRYYDKFGEEAPEYKATSRAPLDVREVAGETPNATTTTSPGGDDMDIQAILAKLAAMEAALAARTSDGAALADIKAGIDAIRATPVAPASPAAPAVDLALADRLAKLEAALRDLGREPARAIGARFTEPVTGAAIERPDTSFRSFSRALSDLRTGGGSRAEAWLSRDEHVALLGEPTQWYESRGMGARFCGAKVVGDWRQRVAAFAAGLMQRALDDGFEPMHSILGGLLGAEQLRSVGLYLPSSPEVDQLIGRAVTASSYTGIVPTILDRVVRLAMLAELGPVAVLPWREGNGGVAWSPPYTSAHVATQVQYLAATAVAGTKVDDTVSGLTYNYRNAWTGGAITQDLIAKSRTIADAAAVRLLNLAANLREGIDKKAFDATFTGAESAEYTGLLGLLHDAETAARKFSAITADTTRITSMATSATAVALTEKKLDEMLDAIVTGGDPGSVPLFTSQAVGREIDQLTRARGQSPPMIDMEGGYKVMSFRGHPIIRTTSIPAVATLAANGATYTALTGGAAHSIVGCNVRECEWRWLTELFTYVPAQTTVLARDVEIFGQHVLAVNDYKHFAGLIGIAVS